MFAKQLNHYLQVSRSLHSISWICRELKESLILPRRKRRHQLLPQNPNRALRSLQNHLLKQRRTKKGQVRYERKRETGCIDSKRGGLEQESCWRQSSTCPRWRCWWTGAFHDRLAGRSYRRQYVMIAIFLSSLTDLMWMQLISTQTQTVSMLRWSSASFVSLHRYTNALLISK